MKKCKTMIVWLLAFSCMISNVITGYAAEPSEELVQAEELVYDDGSESISNGGLLESSSIVSDDSYNRVHDTAIAEALRNQESSIDVRGYGITASNVSSVIWSVVNNYPELYYVKSFSYYMLDGTVTSIVPKYAFTEAEITSMNAEIAAEVSKIDRAIDTKGMSDLEIALAYHDYLAADIVYDNSNYLAGTLPDTVYNIYGAFVKKKAVCQGYAEAFLYLMNRKQIPCGIATSSAANHAWNVIYLDGKWYHMDATWDDPVWDNLGRVSHSYFMISDSTLIAGDSKKADYVTNVPSGYTYAKALDSAYENGFWKNCGTYMYPYQGNWYYLEAIKTGTSSSGTDAYTKYQLVKYQYANGAKTVIRGPETAKWYASSGGYYTNQYGRLAGQAGTIYYSTPSTIEQYKIASGETSTVYTLPSGTATGTYIYGLGYVRGTLCYVVKDSPSTSGDETYQSVQVQETPKYVTSITTNKTDMSLYVDMSEKVELTIAPEDADDQTVTWKSENPEIADVDQNGIIKAKNVGKATITVTANDGGEASASITVYVYKKQPITTEETTTTEATTTETTTTEQPTIKKPGAATSVKAVPAGKNKVTISWNRSADAEGYIIYAKKNGVYGYCGMTTSNTYTDKKASDTEYNFYFVFPYIKNAQGKYITGSYGKYVYAKGIVPAVTELKAYSQKGNVKVTWKKQKDADGYLIYGKVGNKAYSYIGMTSSNTYIHAKASKTAYNFYWVYPYHKNEHGKIVVGQKCAKYVYGKAK